MFRVLKKLSVETKVFTLMSISLILILIFSVDKMYTLHKSSMQMRTIQHHLEHAPYISGLIHELQRERGISAAYLGSHAPKEMLPVLKQQHKRTDEAFIAANRGIFENNLEPVKGQHEREFWAATQALLHIHAMRKKTRSEAHPLEEATQYYTQVINELLVSIKKLNFLSQDIGLVMEITAYTSILQAKEYVGQERALGAIGFAKRKFHSDLYNSFVSSIEKQNMFLTIYQDNASNESRALYEQLIQDDKLEKLTHIEHQVFETLGAFNSTIITSADWFDLISYKVDLLHKVEGIHSDAIFIRISDDVAKVTRTFWIIALIILVISFATIKASLILIKSILLNHKSVKNDAHLQSQRYAKILQANPFGVCETDIKGKIETINQEAITMFGGKSETDFIGVYFVELLSAKDQSAAIDFFKTAPKKATPFFEMRLGGVNKERRYSSCILPIQSTETSEPRLMVLTKDISIRDGEVRDLEKAKASAKTSTQAKAKFIANMNHELRTPLNHILGFAELLQQHPRNIQDQEMLGYVISGGKELLEKVNAILNLSSHDCAEAEIFNITDLPSIITTLEEFEKSAQLEGKIFNIIGLENTLNVISDPQDLLTAVKHILSNALKFTSTGEEISIQFNQINDCAEINIIDTGPGIPQRQLESVTQPFEVLDDSFTRTTGGMGLGLAVSKHLMHKNHGSIGIESIMGKGTCVSLKLPLELGAKSVAKVSNPSTFIITDRSTHHECFGEYNEQVI